MVTRRRPIYQCEDHNARRRELYAARHQQPSVAVHEFDWDSAIARLRRMLDDGRD